MKKLVIVGAGSMSEALISGMIENKMLEGKDIWVTNRSNERKLQALNEKYGVNFTYDLSEFFQDADIVVLAMKPKDAATAITEIKTFLTEKMLVISVLAGVSLETIEELAEKPLAIIRAMPNTSAAIGRSATALTANRKVTAIQSNLARKMFETVGMTTLVKENQMDAITGLSGSGPAYIYYLVEAMEKSAVEIGLERPLAKELIVQTLLGAAEMLTKTTKTPEQLRLDVTSPGGTTEAGVGILEQHGVQKALIECIKEATAQSGRMGLALSSDLKKNKKSKKRYAL